MEITEQERSMVICRVSKAISCIQDGNDATEVLSSIYCENLPDKSTFIGEMMAKNLIHWMEEFENGYAEAYENSEKYLEKCLDEALVDLPAEQREVEKAGFLHELEGQSDLFTDVEDLSPERQELIQDVGEEMTLAVTAMVIYTMAKNGELSGFPRDITLAQVVICTCTEYRSAEIKLGLEQKYISSKDADKQVKGLKSAFYGLMAVAAAVGGTFLTVHGLVAMISFSVGSLILVGGVACILDKIFGKMAQNEQIPEMNVMNNEVIGVNFKPDAQKTDIGRNISQENDEQQEEYHEEIQEDEQFQQNIT